MLSPPLGCPVILVGGTAKGTSVDETKPSGLSHVAVDKCRDRLLDRVAVSIIWRDQVAIGAGIIHNPTGCYPVRLCVHAEYDCKLRYSQTCFQGQPRSKLLESH